MKLLKELYPFQEEGVKFLEEIEGLGVLAHDTGLGKTMMAIAYMLKLKAPTLIFTIAEGGVVQQFAKEIKSWAGISPTIIIGTPAKRKKLWESAHLSYPFPCAIVSYPTAIRDKEHIRKFVAKIRNQNPLIIMDEASKLKNFKKTKIYKIILSIINSFPYRIALTATPLEISPLDTFSIFYLINPKILGKQYYKFFEHHVIYKEYQVGKYRQWTIKIPVRFINLEELRLKILPYLLRVEEDEVTDQLPNLIQKKYLVPMTRYQQKEYDKYYDQIRLAVENEKITTILQIWVKLRQISNSPTTIDNTIPFTPATTPKLQVLSSIFEENPKKTILVMSQYKKFIVELYKYYEKLNPQIVFGGMPHNLRQERINKVRSGESNILFSTDALAYGVNLQFFDYIVHADLHSNPAKVKQRRGRIRRLGSDKETVIEICLISSGTVEEDIYNTKYQIRLSASDLVIDGKSGDTAEASQTDMFLIKELIV